MTEVIVNFNEEREVADILSRFAKLRKKGKFRITVCQHRPRRSDAQNRYYHPCFVKLLADYLREQGEQITDDYAHEILKHKFLRRCVVDKNTGEEIWFTGSTRKLTTVEFNEYLERCAQWLSEMGLVVPEPSVWRMPVAA